MLAGRSRACLLALAAVAVVITACTSSRAPDVERVRTSPAASSSAPSNFDESSSSAGSTEKWSIVALGDSVPAGAACGCIPFPELSAAGLSVPGVRSVSVTNDAVSGSTTTDVLHEVTADRPVIDALRRADAAEIEIGANDIQYSKKCGTDVSCYTPSVPPMERNLDAIVRRVHQLLTGGRDIVVLLDYWNVWLGGQYERARGPAYVHAADSVTDSVDKAIEAVAARTDSAYVDLRLAFKGPSYSYDETRYLASDGDHPNSAGHQRIAAAVVTAIKGRLH
jgi:lysophospholipase L1-like esterase